MSSKAVDPKQAAKLAQELLASHQAFMALLAHLKHMGMPPMPADFRLPLKDPMVRLAAWIGGWVERRDEALKLKCQAGVAPGETPSACPCCQLRWNKVTE